MFLPCCAEQLSCLQIRGPLSHSNHVGGSTFMAHQSPPLSMLSRAVCRSWRHAFSTAELFAMRAEFGLSEAWLLVTSVHRGSLCFHAFDPENQQWYGVATPSVEQKRPPGASTAVLHDQLFVCGGLSWEGHKPEDIVQRWAATIGQLMGCPGIGAPVSAL